MASSLLRDWNFLMERVIPPLREGAGRSPNAWSVNSTADAVAVAAAFAYAEEPGSPHSLRSFATGSGSGQTMSFPLSDIKHVPEAGQTRFQRQQRRWVPDASLANRVVLAEPTGPVDLLTLRPSSAPDSVGQLVKRVRDDGLVLFSDPPPHPPAGLRPDGPGGRLYKKNASGTTSGPEESAPLEASTLQQRHARDRLAEQHVGLARSLARRFAHRGESLDDLEAVAYLALVKAAGRFDDQRGTPFASFATASILGELKRHFRDRTWATRVPRALQELYLSAKDARDELGQQLGRSATVAEVAELIGATEESVIEAMEAGASYRADSIDGWGTDDDSAREIPVSDPSFERVLQRQQLRQRLPDLEWTERTVLKRLFFDGWTQEQVARELGVSQMQVSRLLARCAAKLRR